MRKQHITIALSAVKNPGEFAAPPLVDLPMPDAMLRLPQVLKLYPVGKSTWWAGIKEGRYPRWIKLSERTIAWKASDIYKLIECQSTQSDE